MAFRLMIAHSTWNKVLDFWTYSVPNYIYIYIYNLEHYKFIAFCQMIYPRIR